MKAALILLALALPASAQTLATTGGTKPAATSAPTNDHPKLPIHTWRVIYTITESDNGKLLGVQHQSLTLTEEAGSNTIRLGSRVPIVTGTYSNKGGETDGRSQQVTYIDVGININARFDLYPSGGAAGPLALPPDAISLHSKVEQSSIVEDPHALHDDPVIRQTTLDNTAVLSDGATTRIGSMDIPGSTRHFDIDVTLEKVK